MTEQTNKRNRNLLNALPREWSGYVMYSLTLRRHGLGDGSWDAEYGNAEYAKEIIYTGRGRTAEEALVEARVNNLISNHAHENPGAPALTQTQMNALRRATYQDHLGFEPEGEYRCASTEHARYMPLTAAARAAQKEVLPESSTAIQA